MKTLELNQMELVLGGDYGDTTCSEFWTSASVGIGAAGIYAGALFGIAGGVVAWVLSSAASYYAEYGCEVE